MAKMEERGWWMEQTTVQPSSARPFRVCITCTCAMPLPHQRPGTCKSHHNQALWHTKAPSDQLSRILLVPHEWRGAGQEWRITFSAAKESRPEVGSSRKSSTGFPSSSHPMLRRFFSPPLNPLFLASPVCCRPAALFICVVTMASKSVGSQGTAVKEPKRGPLTHWGVSGASQSQPPDEGISSRLLLC